MFDVYAWIMSKEIRDYLRANYELSFMERMQLVRTAYRPMEERLAALLELRKEAVSPKEKKFADQVIRLYRFMLREICESRPEQFYIRKLPVCGIRQNEQRIGRTFVYHSFEEMLGDIPEEITEVEKWEITEDGIRELITFDLHLSDGRVSITNTYLDEARHEEIGIRRKIIEQENWFYFGDLDYNYRYPYPLPFSTGDLARLDAPVYEEPLYGVMYSENYSGQYVHMGIICEEDGIWNFDMLDLSSLEIDMCAEFRVVDWLHHAKPEELPEELKILVDLGKYFTDLRRQGPEAIEDPFFRIFGCRREKSREIRPFRRIPVTFQELMEVYEEDRKSACIC